VRCKVPARCEALVAATLLAAGASLGGLVAGAMAPWWPAPASALGAVVASPRSLDPFGPEGMNLDKALASFGPGSPDVTVAYVEGGINWHLPDAATLASVVAVNWHELPVPCSGSSLATATMVVGGVTEPCHTVYSSSFADYDVDHDGRVNAAEWSHDPRVVDANHNGVIDPEDLIAAFCGPGYNPPEDPPGYRCAVSGWDFYDNQNDPATPDASYTHANDQMDRIHRECPACTILPVKAGDEALDSTEDLAKAWLFAAESGAQVIVSVTADLGYSPFMRSVIDYCESLGIAMVEASNDFDSTDHQGGMFWPYVVPGNGAVATADQQAWTRSDLTSWGTHAMFTVPTGGGSTSESTPTTGGILALLWSYGLEAASEGVLPKALNGPQLEQLLRATAMPVEDPSLPWPGGGGSSDGWNLQYGYGIPNVAAAAQAIFEGRTPPEAAITSPDWYDLLDPTAEQAVAVTGTIVATSPGDVVSWTLEAAPGAQPVDAAWQVIGSGSAVGSFSGTLGTLPLSIMPAARADAPAFLSGPPTDKTIASSEQYAVTIRLLVRDVTNDTSAEDRRAVNIEHDPSVLAGFPIHVDASVESQPALVDLQGTGRLDLVFGDASGTIHAIDPATGRELPGWPVTTDPVSVPDAPAGIDPGHEPVLAPVAVGDLFGDGHVDVVATSLDGKVYAFDAFGHLLPGWPKAVGQGLSPPPVPRPELPHVRLALPGATAPPVLAPLEGGPGLDVVQAGWDGKLHAWQPDGTDVPGWPVTVSLPSPPSLPPGYVLEDDQKLDTPPAVAWLDGPGKPDLVVRSQLSEIDVSSNLEIQPLPFGFVFAYGPDGRLLPGWPVKLPGLAEFYGSAMEFLTEGSDAPIAADLDGSGRDEVVVNALWSPPIVLDASGRVIGTLGNAQAAASSMLAVAEDPELALDPSALPPEVPIAFTGWGSVGPLGPPGSPLVYAQDEVGSSSFAAAELVPDAGLGIDQLVTAWQVALGGGQATPMPGFPALGQGLDLFGAPLFVDVTSEPANALVVGSDSGVVAAYTAGGGQAPGFPKFTGGWVAFGPVAGDLLGNGTTDVVAGTREGWLFAWATSGRGDPSGEQTWWRVRHDDWNSGNLAVEPLLAAPGPGGLAEPAQVGPAPSPSGPQGPGGPGGGSQPGGGSAGGAPGGAAGSPSAGSPGPAGAGTSVAGSPSAQPGASSMSAPPLSPPSGAKVPGGAPQASLGPSGATRGRRALRRASPVGAGGSVAALLGGLGAALLLGATGMLLARRRRASGPS
jgi:hypothetical protein